MKRNQMQYKGYTGSIEWSEPDGVFYGNVLGIKDLLLYEGNTIEELRKDFHGFVDEYLQDCKDKNIQPEKPYKGNFNIRVGSDLHTLAIERADKEGISLNKLVCNALKAYLL